MARQQARGGIATERNSGEEKEWTRATDGKMETDGPMRARSTTAFPYSLGLSHTRYTVHHHPNP